MSSRSFSEEIAAYMDKMLGDYARYISEHPELAEQQTKAEGKEIAIETTSDAVEQVNRSPMPSNPSQPPMSGQPPMPPQPQMPPQPPMSNQPHLPPNYPPIPQENVQLPPNHPPIPQGNVQLPPNHPPIPQGNVQLPPNHPPIPQGNVQLPPNHPPIPQGNVQLPPNYPPIPQENVQLPPNHSQIPEQYRYNRLYMENLKNQSENISRMEFLPVQNSRMEQSQPSVPSQPQQPQRPEVLTPEQYFTAYEQANPYTGSMRVQTLKARGTLPVVGANVTISKEFPTGEYIIARLITDSSGQTDIIELPAPSRQLSQTPQDETPYAVYKLLIEDRDSVSVLNRNAPVFADTLSLQIVEMIPKSVSNGMDTMDISAPEGEELYSEVQRQPEV